MTNAMHAQLFRNHDLLSLFDGITHFIVGDGNSKKASGIAYRSDQVSPGDIFFCIVGTVSDGHSYAQDAVNRGAVAIVAERALYIDQEDVPVIIVGDTKKAMGEVASKFFGNPSHHMNLVGITGTNGKTTTTYLVSHILNTCGHDCGVIGTTGAFINGEHVEIADRTTPEAPVTNHLLYDMYQSGCDSCAMEVSSHALSLRRVWGLDFSVTAFTNLTQDHLDYHHSFEEYFEAKARLFSFENPAVRVINADDDWGQELIRRCSDAGDEMMIYSMFESEGADIYPLSATFRHDRTEVSLKIMDTTFSFAYPLVGRFNLQNVMCAIACAIACGCDKKEIVHALKDEIKVPGRMECVTVEECKSNEAMKKYDIPSVYVDYAHTPDAITEVGATVALLKDGIDHEAVIVVGCGGDRDADKRPLMGQAALQRMDFAYITSDNPRTEDPNEIIEDIVVGLRDKKYQGKYTVIADRAEAIGKAINNAHYGDVVLIAGKGHEDYQIIGTVKRHFDDREVAAEAIRLKIENASKN